MRVFYLLGIQSPNPHDDILKNWGDYPEGEAIYKLSLHGGAILSETALKASGYIPCSRYWHWSGHPIIYFKYFKEQPGD